MSRRNDLSTFTHINNGALRITLRILWVTSSWPDGAGGDGRDAEFDLLAPVASAHQVEILSGQPPPGEASLDIAGRTLPATRVPWRSRVGASTRAGFAFQLLRSWPTHERWIAADRLRALGAAIRNHEQRHGVDRVVLYGTELAPLAPVCRAPAAVITLELDSHRWRREAALAKTRARALRWNLEARRARLWERRWMSPSGPVIGDQRQLDAWLQTMTSPRVDISLPESEPTAPTADSPSGSIVLCTRDRPDLLRRAARSVSSAIADTETEFIIVEQGAPSAAALCQELGLDAVVVHDSGVGAARARNIGATRAAGDVLLFTDDDCEVPPTWMSDHLREFSDREVVASFGVVTGLSRLRPRAGAADERDPVSWRGRHRRGALPWNIGHSANMAVRRSAFFDVGGFDERLGPGAPDAPAGEDSDLIVRLLEDDGLAVSGVGRPVRHAQWRSEQETASNLVSYERGSGAWIGKALRSNRSSGGHYLRDRLRLLRGLLSWPGLREPKLVASSVSAFFSGLAAGYRMGPWPPRDHSRTVR
jgi:hypothetical protein